jgi:hypothetical protein
MTKVIEHQQAYDRAVKRNILNNATKTWRETTERSGEIEFALNAGRTDEYNYADGFMGSMAKAFDTYGKLTPNQSAAILKGIDARAARKAEWAAQNAAQAAQKVHVGTVGEKLVMTITTVHIVLIETAYGTIGLYICEDGNKNTIIYKGNAKGFPNKGESAMVIATIKEHAVRDGVKQTIIQRPKVIVDTTEEA